MTRRVHPLGVRLRRSILVLSVLAAPSLLGGCAGTPMPQVQTAAVPVKQPGTIDSYIREAAQKFNMPERWIRAVMQQESGGRTLVNGHPIVSEKGAMGLMQVMPATWAYLRDAYGLGNDPFDPHDNIIAGTAYLREMYDLYGSPGFLAAYNAGPGRYEVSLKTSRPLPGETRHYVAVIAPKLDGVSPDGPSPTRPARATALAMRSDAPAHSAFDGDAASGPVLTTAALPAPVAPVLPTPAPVRVAALPAAVIPAPVVAPVPAAAPAPLPAPPPVRAAVAPEPPPIEAQRAIVVASAETPAPTAHAAAPAVAPAPAAATHPASHPATAATTADPHLPAGLVYADHRNLPPGWYVPVAYTR